MKYILVIITVLGAVYMAYLSGQRAQVMDIWILTYIVLMVGDKKK